VATFNTFGSITDNSIGGINSILDVIAATDRIQLVIRQGCYFCHIFISFFRGFAVRR